MHPSRQLAVWALGLACSSTLMAQQPRTVTKGDEQGLTPFAHADLAADRQAVDEAVGGWWAKAQRNVNGRTRWFRDARFGCFVHWGVYSQAAGYWQGHPVGGYSEHLMRKAKIPLQQYKKALVSTFDPIHFDAEEWMQRVADAGMRYFVITAKHHDGFAMYPSAAYPYDIRLTRCKRDPMMELREAARRHGIKFGFYYSHAFDWEHPCAPGNDWEYDHPGGDRKLGGTNWWNSDYKWFLDSAERYVAEKSIPQIKELIKTYQPDILWFDTPGKLPLYLNIRILKAIRDADTQLSIVVNGRLVRWGNRNMGDYRNTGDRAAFFPPTQGLWESIPTTNESYGYNAADNRHKPVSHFVRLLEDAVSRGGNILMNVGPMGDGRWDEKDVTIFKGIGRWLKTNGEGVYHTRAWRISGEGPHEEGHLSKTDVRFTCKGTRTVYAFVKHWDGRPFIIHALKAAEIESVTALDGGTKVKFGSAADGVLIKAEGHVAEGKMPNGPATAFRIRLKNGKRVLFIGDSITDGGWGRSGGSSKPSAERNQTDWNHLYGHSYMMLCAARYQSRYPAEDVQFFNRGISGNTLAQMADRWDEDAVDIWPDIVTVLIGTNDVTAQRSAHPGQPFDTAAWGRLYRSLLDRMRASNPDVRFVLCTPFTDGRATNEEEADVTSRRYMINQCAAEVKRIAAEYDAVCLPFNELFDRLKTQEPRPKYWIWDGIHPTPAGHERMAEMWLKALGRF